MFSLVPSRLFAEDPLQLAGGDWVRPFFDTRDLSRWNALAAARESEVQNTDKEFRIRMDMRHFKPEEIHVTSKNNCLTVTAKHEEKEDTEDKHCFVSRSVTRSYKLPDDVDSESVTSVLNNQGVMLIKAQKKALEAPKEYKIPVEFKK